MKISDMVANFILEALENSNGNAKIQRNELANLFGCVPSQINYVITSRFTPEQGYLVESRRGGGGCIKITQVQMDKSSAIMHVVNSIGNKIDHLSSKAIVQNLLDRNIIANNVAKLILCAISERLYTAVPPEFRQSLRATLLKNMLLSQL